MRELPAPPLPAERGEPLEHGAYISDFRARRRATRDHAHWKLERRQHFEENDHPARDALRRGDWAEALRLFESKRETVRQLAEADQRNGAPFRRLRVVEEPLTPYTQWELTALRVRAEEGQAARVLLAKEVAAAETEGPLPEIVIIGGHTLYEIIYTEAGAFESARRYTEPEIVAPWLDFVREAYAGAEDLRDYHERAVAHLPPPPAA
ncbi:hypothetical protein E0L36_21070 [Streptomyces sp. AJS327]|uniref:DUF6879 family protein n=1 Tax=Streptomyces sp. AJS327 TaxID=2545265 RepID=UPI0015DF47D0|nr:DUF6879 family protein [Streptomyces sp. AJS327]MBA0053275.1 hypothetical protein [Streptomyces sp. AJS327]